MKLNKLLIPVLTLTSLPACLVPLTSCNKSSSKGFSFGNNKTFVPSKQPLTKQDSAITKNQLIDIWLTAITNDPNIFYEDVHYAIDRELYIPEDQYNLFTIFPQGSINFTYLKVGKDEQGSKTLSFEMEYTYLVQINKDAQIFGPDWWKVELEGRIDVYDFPIAKALASDTLIGQYKAYNNEEVPYVAVKLDGVKEENWYIHGIEIGYVWDKDGKRFETAHNGWISGYDRTYDRGELGYFIGVVPFLYDWPDESGSKCLNISNYYFKNNVRD